MCANLFFAESAGACVRCHRERCVLWVFVHLCVCGGIFAPVQHRCVTAHLQSEQPCESNAMSTTQNCGNCARAACRLGCVQVCRDGIPLWVEQTLSIWLLHCLSSWSLLLLSRLPSVPLAHWQQRTLPREPTPTHQLTARELLSSQFSGVFPCREPESEDKLHWAT